MTKKYVLHPGYVTSRNDGQRHFIGPQQLCGLYGVSLAECFVRSNGPGPEPNYPEGLQHLYPRWDGKYEKVKQ